MSKVLPGFNEEQMSAELKRMHDENPYKDRYEALSAQIEALREERLKYAPRGSASLALMIMLTGSASSDTEIAKRMNNQQLCEAAIEHGCWSNGGISEAIFDEVMDRLGYKYQGSAES
jgi:hypothetical protein